MPFLGTLINAAVIVIFSLIGSLMKFGIPERISRSMFYAISVAVIYLGLDGAISTAAPDVPEGFFLNAGLTKFSVIILSLVIGTAIGEAIDIEKYIGKLGAVLEKRMPMAKSSPSGSFAKGFIICTFTSCVGAMSVQGAILDGVGNADVLIAKSVLDAISCLVFASTLGIGCAFAAVPMIVYQGGITLLSLFVSDFIPTESLSYLSATGSLILVLIGTNLLGATKVKTSNMTPAIFVSLIFHPLINLFA